jgi:hypothetical protein
MIRERYGAAAAAATDARCDERILMLLTSTLPRSLSHSLRRFLFKRRQHATLLRAHRTASLTAAASRATAAPTFVSARTPPNIASRLLLRRRHNQNAS